MYGDLLQRALVNVYRRQQITLTTFTSKGPRLIIIAIPPSSLFLPERTYVLSVVITFAFNQRLYS